jgi:hypothetical protein
VILLGQLAAVGQRVQDAKKRDALIVDTRLFDAFAKAEVQLGSAQPAGVGGTEKIVGKGSAGCSREAEEPVVFKPTAYGVIETVP